ncbi:DUF6063 family protein [Maridesulfovibrio sp.]|uniref:DUF6063 family protein n=1 Tax=Maridesulfovibrio sp. TaxID=2795000 RepID=UPI003B00A15B
MLERWSAGDAARLIGIALNPKASPLQNRDYADLLQLMSDEPEFRQLVDEVALGLGLRVYYADDYGCVLGVVDKSSRFALKLGDLREHFTTEDTAALMILMTVVIVAFFPSIEALEDDDYRNNEFINMDGLVNILNQYLADAAKRSEGEDEGPEQMLAKGWRYLEKLPPRKPDMQRVNKGSREGLLHHVLNFFQEHAFVTMREEEEQLRVTPTKRLRIQARELLGNHLFTYLFEMREGLKEQGD